MVQNQLKQFLDRNDVPYETITHPRAATAPETAEAAHVSGKEFAKTVIVRLDGELAMAVVPAHTHVDLARLKDVAHAESAELAQEQELLELFPSCELGAMPPFGNLYDMPVYLHEDLDESREIVFNAGTHTDLIKMPFQTYVNLVKPVRTSIAGA